MSTLSVAIEPRPDTRVTEALRLQLHELRRVIDGLAVELYCARPSRVSGSVGEHVRHCLDHARALLQGMAGGPLTYDSRLRGTRVETEPPAATRELDAICADLARMEGMDADAPLWLETLVHADEPSAAVITTLGRETAYVIQHTIHHCAVVAVLLDILQAPVPSRFGHAPSTPARH